MKTVTKKNLCVRIMACGGPMVFGSLKMNLFIIFVYLLIHFFNVFQTFIVVSQYRPLNYM